MVQAQIGHSSIINFLVPRLSISVLVEHDTFKGYNKYSKGFMEVKVLPENEWYRLNTMYKRHGGELPAKGTAVIFVIEENNEIIATSTLQLLLHAGGLWIDPLYRGKGLWLKIKAFGEKWLRNTPIEHYYMFPSNSMSSSVAKKLGAEEMPWKVFKVSVKE